MLKKNILTSVLMISFCTTFSQVISVSLVQENENWMVYRGGEPYFVKGAGGSDFLGRLSEYGGNSIRTWGTDAETIHLLDSAHSLGLSVCMGLWVRHQQHGFNYNDEAAVQAQFDEFKHWVETYKDHPAVLFWALGNEVELGVDYNNLNLNVWDAINDLSEMIHEVDGNHPTLTVTAAISDQKLQDIMTRAPDLDILGVNCYGCIGSVENIIDRNEWNKPYMITEWGPNGQWESPTTSWDATIEATSTEKADLYFNRYNNAILSDPDKVIGSYVFLWGNKFEETPTWYGLFFDGYETGAVDEMTYHWSGTYPENRAPKIFNVRLNEQPVNESVTLREEFGNTITFDVEDEDLSLLTYEYLIQPEQGNNGTVTDDIHVLPYIPDLFTETQDATATFDSPENFGTYRLYYFVRDDDNNIGLGNFPFQVNLAPMVSDDPTVFFASKDAYVRDGEFEAVDYGVEDTQRLITRLSDTKDQGFLRETYLSFDLSTINESFTSAEIAVFGGNTEGVKTVLYGIGDFSWNESRISWNSRSEDDKLVPLDTVSISSEQKYHTWDVTSHVFAQLVAGKDNLSFVLRNITTDPSLTIWSSRETRPNPPKITFDFDGGELVLGVKKNKLDVYPNPSDEIIYLHDSKNAEYKIFSLQGNVVQKGTVLDNSISVQQLRKGTYILQIDDRKSKKIVVE